MCVWVGGAASVGHGVGRGIDAGHERPPTGLRAGGLLLMLDGATHNRLHARNGSATIGRPRASAGAYIDICVRIYVGVVTTMRRLGLRGETARMPEVTHARTHSRCTGGDVTVPPPPTGTAAPARARSPGLVPAGAGEFKVAAVNRRGRRPGAENGPTTTTVFGRPGRERPKVASAGVRRYPDTRN